MIDELSYVSNHVKNMLNALNNRFSRRYPEINNLEKIIEK